MAKKKIVLEDEANEGLVQSSVETKEPDDAGLQGKVLLNGEELPEVTTEKIVEEGTVNVHSLSDKEQSKLESGSEVASVDLLAQEKAENTEVDAGEDNAEQSPRQEKLQQTDEMRETAGRELESKSERQLFYELDFHELDRDLTEEERQEWNSIYASFRGRSALTGKIVGVDPLSVNVRNRKNGQLERQTMYCAIVVPYRVRIVIPASEMWEAGEERPDFVLQNMVGANIDLVIIKVDREAGFAVGSRRLAARAQRHYFKNRQALHTEGTRQKCRVLAVGPRRCLVECFGYDVDLTQRDLRYTAIPDLRQEYHPGDELDCVIKDFDPEGSVLHISVKETQSNPFDGAELRHPVGCRRQAVIAGKYGGGVFCNLPDGTVCMCNYAYRHEDSDFMVGDTVILMVQRFEVSKKQMYGKILTKW